MDPYEKHLQRIRKLIALAGSTSYDTERASAVRMACEYLRQHPAPLRWHVRAGTDRLLIVPAQMLLNDLTTAGRTLRRQANRNPLWLDEVHRVKTSQLDIGAAGYLHFERFGYAIFVPLDAVEAYL